MELNFDKEMDALLRQTARSGEIVSTNTETHLDADEISAFSENALPEKTRAVYIKHLADCDRCRTILSNLILLNAEAETETASSAVPTAPEIVETEIPWYRKMFLMPNLAYTMGALVLVFGGFLGFLVLQNTSDSGVFDMARTAANNSAASGPNAGDEAMPSGMSNAMTNTAASDANSAIASNANSAVYSSNMTSNSANMPSAPSEPADERRDQKNQTLNEQKEKDVPADSVSRETQSLAKTAEEEKLADKPKPARQETVPNISAGASQPAPPPSKDDDEDSTQLRAKKMAKAEANSRRVGGKTFNRTGGVWVDSAYDKSAGANMSLPPTQTVRRGSNEYKKLDKEVRVIAESVDGAVIIVWKSKAYRIQ